MTGFVGVLIEIVTGFVCCKFQLDRFSGLGRKKKKKKKINYGRVLNVAKSSVSVACFLLYGRAY